MLVNVLASISTPPDGFSAPGTEIFDYTTSCLVGDGQYCLTRVTFWMLMSAVIVVGLFLLAFRNPSLVPRKLQNAMESIVEFIRNGIVMETMGPEGLGYLPFLTSLFMFIWINNLFGIIPGINFPTTSRMAIPAFLAVLVWFVFNIVGIAKQGGWHYIKGVLFPPGVPAPIYVLVTPIEFVSVFFVRPLTLAVRLAANMIAGHLILTIFALGSWYLFSHLWTPGADWVASFGIFSFALLVFMTAFEVLVGVLQAYIFTILTAVYISGAIHPEH
jgi:F-type H+-transporting ATPase subunit a